MFFLKEVQVQKYALDSVIFTGICVLCKSYWRSQGPKSCILTWTYRRHNSCYMIFRPKNRSLGAGFCMSTQAKWLEYSTCSCWIVVACTEIEIVHSIRQNKNICFRSFGLGWPFVHCSHRTKCFKILVFLLAWSVYKISIALTVCCFNHSHVVSLHE